MLAFQVGAGVKFPRWKVTTKTMMATTTTTATHVAVEDEASIFSDSLMLLGAETLNEADQVRYGPIILNVAPKV